MSYQQFVVSDNNPNDNTGGGGCICDPLKQIDCKPPYVIFYGTEMADMRSPHVVACQACLAAGLKACSGEALSVGEKGYTPEALPVPVVLILPDVDSLDDDEELPDI